MTAFFAGLGFETEGRTVLEGEFPDTVTGMPDSRTEIVMLRPRGGGTGLDLSPFIRPGDELGSPHPMPNELGLRNVTFEVGDLQAILDGSPRTATIWPAAPVSTRASGAWRLCADPRGLS